MTTTVSNVFDVTVRAAPVHVPGEPWGYKVANDGYGISQGGTFIDGGRGNDPQYVTNLNANGAGSLKALAENGTPGPILFEVGGVVDGGTEKIQMTGVSDKTVWGNVAPGGHFNLHQGGGLFNSSWTIRRGCNNIIVQHIAIRTLDNVVDRDCFYVAINAAPNDQWNTNILVAHMSFAFGSDEQFGHANLAGGSTASRALDLNVTFYKCFAAFPLQSPTGGNTHGLNQIMSGGSRIGNIECIFAHGLGRPLFACYEDACHLNILHYLWQAARCFNVTSNRLTGAQDARYRWEGCRYIGHDLGYPGVANPSAVGEEESNALDGLVYHGNSNDLGGFDYGSRIADKFTGNDAGFLKPDGYETRLLPSSALDNDWIDTVGANPATPDSVDVEARNDIKTQTGTLIDNVPDVPGGYPNLPSVSHSARGAFTNLNTFGGQSLQQHLENKSWWGGTGFEAGMRHTPCTNLGYSNRTKLEAYLDTFVSGVPGTDPN